MKITIHTDGSCSPNPGPGGWGAIFNLPEGCKRLRGHELDTTNNRMELLAAVVSLEKVSTAKKAIREVEIISDSAYVVNAVNKLWIPTWKSNGWKNGKGDPVKNKELWVRLDLVMANLRKQKVNVVFTKVKGHSGNTFNELVDQLAKSETDKAMNKSQEVSKDANN